MNEIIRIVLPTYFLLYFGYVFIYKSWVVAKEIGKSPMVFSNDNSAYSLIGTYFKIIHVLLIIYTCLFGVFPMIHPWLSPISLININNIKYVGLTFLIIGLIWTIIAQKNMKNAWRMGIDTHSETNLITNGLFAYTRNPVFVGLLLSFGGLFLVTPNTFTLIIFLIEFILIQIQIRLEETHLEKLHGEIYLNYKATTKRLI